MNRLKIKKCTSYILLLFLIFSSNFYLLVNFNTIRSKIGKTHDSRNNEKESKINLKNSNNDINGSIAESIADHMIWRLQKSIMYNILGSKYLPLMNIDSPSRDDLFGLAPPSFSLTVNELGIEERWYTINDGDTKTFFSTLSGTINITEWNKLKSGYITITFTVRYDDGFFARASIRIEKDITAPQISIITPPVQGYYGTQPPSFELSITENYLDTVWYTIEGSSGKYIANLSDTIDATTWSNLGNGSVLIEFYANDILGNEGYKNITIFKDLIPPSSDISYITVQEPNIILDWTKITLTADDGFGSGISKIEYRINEEPWIDYQEPFDLYEYDPGQYIISYRAIDAVGNIEDTNTELIIMEVASNGEEEPTNGDQNGGDNQVLMLMFISVGVAGGIIGLGLIIFFIRKRM